MAKRRPFVWLDARTCPDSALIAVARGDDTTFGLLHDRLREAWPLRATPKSGFCYERRQWLASAHAALGAAVAAALARRAASPRKTCWASCWP